MFNIRIGEWNDACSLADLWRLYAKTAYSHLRKSESEHVAKLMIKAYGVVDLLVMEKNRCPVGYLLQHNNWLQALYVVPYEKCSGVGSRLLDYARTTYGKDTPLYTVVHDSNLEGLVFCLKRGFKPQKRETVDRADLPYVSHHLYLPPVRTTR